MKKLILSIIIFSLLFGGVVLAQETQLPDPGLTPDSPFYFFDTLGEKIGMFFTFGTEKKAEKTMKYAEEKLAEAKVMAEKGKTKALSTANKKYQQYLDLAQVKVGEIKKEKNRKRMLNLISEKTSKHRQLLLKLHKKVSKPAKKKIKRTMEITQAPLTPQQTIRKWYKAIVGEDWDTVFKYTVNTDGQPYSEQCKTKTKERLGSWVGATYSLSLEPATQKCRGGLLVSEKQIQNLNKLGCRSVGYSIKMEGTSIGKLSTKGTYWVIRDEKRWKVVFQCKEISPKKPSPEVKEEVWPTEPKQKALASCQKIELASSKEKCINIIKKNANKCKDSNCYLYVGTQTKDLSLCEKIREENNPSRYKKLLCEAVVKEDARKCKFEKEMGMYGGHECNSWIALNKNDPTLCDSPMCKALVKKDLDFCLKLKFKEEECYFAMAGLTGNAEICNALSGTELVGERASCIKIANRDLSGIDCSKNYRMCHLTAMLKEDPSMCKRIEYGGFGSVCYKWLAFIAAKVVPKPYAIHKEIHGIPSIKTVAKKCSEIGGEILSSSQGCRGTIVETTDTTLCCVKSKDTFIHSDITFPKKTFKLGESLGDIHCKVKNQGQSFRGLTLYPVRKKGEIVGIGRQIGPMGGSSVPCLFALPPGDYSLGVEVYKCSEVEKNFGISCDQVELKKIIQSLRPLNKIEKSFTILEEIKCEEIENTEERNNCWSNVAIALKDLSICEEKVKDRKMCYHYIAVDKKNPSICEKIKSERWKAGCYESLAVEIGDSSLCEKINPFYSMDKDNCYKSLAKKTGDLSLCKRIKDTKDRKECYEEVKE